MKQIKPSQEIQNRSRLNNKSSDMTYGKKSHDYRAELEGAQGKKRIGNRNDFMGSGYQELAFNIQNEF
jgi:hypothetical protein